MSLVERALKKIQESKAAPAGNGDQRAAIARFGNVIESSSALVLEDVPARPPQKTVRIDRTALRRAGLLPPENQERPLADEYRQIKRPLIARAIGRGEERIANGQLIMMASAIPGDGKTFTSINLALSMAMEKELSVLLVDADVAKPHISKVFGVDAEPGLLDVLRDESVDVESVILRTDVPRLSLLSAGQSSDTASELLASSRMQQTVGRLGARDPNRIVLFDSPPLLLTSESRALATVVGQIVLVVCAGRTPQQAVFDALDLLGDNKSIGLVLNQSDESTPGGYRYGYYGSGSSERPISDTSSES